MSIPYGPDSNTRREPATGRVNLRELMQAEARVNKHPYLKVNGWQVCQAAEQGRGPDIPPFHFWAAHWDLDERLVIAATLSELEAQVLARQEAMYERLPLALRNRRALAERIGWPAGVVEQCEELEERYPAWAVSWRSGAYVARLDVPMHACERAATDAAELDVLMEEVPQRHDYSVKGCTWCLARLWHGSS